MVAAIQILPSPAYGGAVIQQREREDPASGTGWVQYYEYVAQAALGCRFLYFRVDAVRKTNGAIVRSYSNLTGVYIHAFAEAQNRGCIEFEIEDRGDTLTYEVLAIRAVFDGTPTPPTPGSHTLMPVYADSSGQIECDSSGAVFYDD